MTVALPEALHPVAVFVNVTVYVPAVLVILEAVVSPVFQRYVTPEAGVAVRVDVRTVQVKSLLLAMVGVGLGLTTTVTG